MTDEYTTTPTHLRIFSDAVIDKPESREWFLDGADDEGRYTEECWSYDSLPKLLANIEGFITILEEGATKFSWRPARLTSAQRHAEVDRRASDQRVRFSPEAWIRDNAVPVDPEGETDWTVSLGTAVMIDDAHARGSDLDFVKGDHFAPAWVRDWHGPFTIHTIDDDGIVDDDD